MAEMGDSDTNQSLGLQERLESQQGEHGLEDEGSSSCKPEKSATNRPLQQTNDCFSSDTKPKSLLRSNSNMSSTKSFQFRTPVRTGSSLSTDNSFKALNCNDDDDGDSLASDMESLCSIRDSSYRLDSNHNAKKSVDLPPVQPKPPPASSLLLGSPLSTSTSRLMSPGHLARYSGGRSSHSSEVTLRKSLLISKSNGSKKDGPILPYPGIT